MFIIIFLHLLTTVQAAGNSNCAPFPVLPISALDANIYLPDKDGRRDYVRFTDARGVKILGVDAISDYVLADAARVIAGIMDRLKPQLSNALRAKNQHIHIVEDTHGAGLTDIDGNWCWIPKFDGADKCKLDDHGPWGFLIHEFGHAVNGVFKNLDSNLQKRLDASYQNAKTNKIWPADTYGMTDVFEYFPLCWTPSWYKIDHACLGDDPSFCSRDLCARRDPTLYGIVSDIRTGDELNLECATRCNPTTVSRLPAECKTSVRVTSSFDRRLSSGSPLKCYSECQKDANCRASTYDAQNRYGSDCFLYNGQTQTTNEYDWTTCFRH